MEVDLRLARADFGADYTPTEASAKLKTELQLQTKLEPHITVIFYSHIQLVSEERSKL